MATYLITGASRGLGRALAETSALTNGPLDYLIANAAYVSGWSEADFLSYLGEEDASRLRQDLRDHFNINVIIAISTGMADADLVVKYDVDTAAPYAISKASLNFAVAKYSAEYRSQEVLILSIAPGYVNTGHYERVSDDHKAKFQVMGVRFAAYAPHLTGATTPEKSIKQVLSVISQVSIDGGYGGAFISHLGNKQWLWGR